MDSELTLVNPDPPTAYYLSSTDLEETVIFAQPSVPLYRVTSDARHIKICDASNPDHIIAVFHRRDLLSDTISFPHRRARAGSPGNMSIQRWLKRSKLPHETPTFTFDTEYGPYVWKIVSRSQMKVFADYDLENPVATCYNHRSQTTGKPTFVIQSSGEPLRDDIVVAYFVQRYRVMLESNALHLFVGKN